MVYPPGAIDLLEWWMFPADTTGYACCSSSQANPKKKTKYLEHFNYTCELLIVIVIINIPYFERALFSLCFARVAREFYVP